MESQRAETSISSYSAPDFLDMVCPKLIWKNCWWKPETKFHISYVQVGLVVTFSAEFHSMFHSPRVIFVFPALESFPGVVEKFIITAECS